LEKSGEALTGIAGGNVRCSMFEFFFVRLFLLNRKRSIFPFRASDDKSARRVGPPYRHLTWPRKPVIFAL